MRLLLAYAAVVSAVTAAVDPARIAATQHGALWRIVTSGLRADDPVVASIAGIVVVGAVTILVAGTRVTLATAVIGHIASALVVYAALDAARRTVTTLDYGTSAITAAWVGVLVYALWSRGRRRAAVGFFTVAAIVGWLCKGQLTVLDWEHAFAVAVGWLAVPTMAAWRHVSKYGTTNPRWSTR